MCPQRFRGTAIAHLIPAAGNKSALSISMMPVQEKELSETRAVFERVTLAAHTAPCPKLFLMCRFSSPNWPRSSSRDPTAFSCSGRHSQEPLPTVRKNGRHDAVYVRGDPAVAAMVPVDAAAPCS